MFHNNDYKKIVKDWLHSIVASQEIYKFEYKKFRQNFCLYCKTKTDKVFCTKFCSLVYINNDYYNNLDCNIVDMFNFELLTENSQLILKEEIKNLNYQNINVKYIAKKDFNFETTIKFIKLDNTFVEKKINLKLIFNTLTSKCFLCNEKLQASTTTFKKSFCSNLCHDVFVFQNYNHYPYKTKLNNKLCRLEYFENPNLILNELKKKIQDKKYNLNCYINNNKIDIILLLDE